METFDWSEFRAYYEWSVRNNKMIDKWRTYLVTQPNRWSNFSMVKGGWRMIGSWFIIGCPIPLIWLFMWMWWWDHICTCPWIWQNVAVEATYGVCTACLPTVFKLELSIENHTTHLKCCRAIVKIKVLMTSGDNLHMRSGRKGVEKLHSSISKVYLLDYRAASTISASHWARTSWWQC